MKLKEYFKSIKDRKIDIIGMGVSNTPLIKLMAEYGCDITVRDKRTDIEPMDGVKFRLGEDYLSAPWGDMVFRTPGMHPEKPELLEAVRGGSVLTSEMELFFDLCPCMLIGITGSDGKTTTTTIISEMLKRAGKRVFLGGNIGAPLLPRVDEMGPDDVAVVELSSFQLMTMKKSPDIAVYTNFAPNHLDIHKDLQEYYDAKLNIFAHQKPGDLAVFNGMRPETAAMKAPGRSLYFGVPGGAMDKDGILVGSDGTPVLPVREIRVPGSHNAENYMAAITALWGIVSPEDMAAVAREFGGVEHRLEHFHTARGVKYINDSIASSPTRAIAGLRCFSTPLILVAGGHDKKIPFDGMAEEMKAHVKMLLLCGETAEKIRLAAESAGFAGEIREFSNLRDTAAFAVGAAQPGDTVLFSPACSSFDQFKNFEVRGRTFKALIKELAAE